MISPTVPRISPIDEPRHRAFMRALAHGDSSSTNWLAGRAGLLVLRYVDAWASGEWLPIQLLAERGAVTDAIRDVPVGVQFRGLLSVILDRTATEWAIAAGGEPYARRPAVARIAPPLLAY